MCDGLDGGKEEQPFLRGDHPTGDAQQREETNLVLTLIDYNERGPGTGLLMRWPRGGTKGGRLVQLEKSVGGSKEDWV